MKKTKITKIPAEVFENPSKFAKEADIKTLVKTLKTASLAYYNTGESLLTDDIYDIMKDILEQRDPTNEFLSEIGAPVAKNKVQLPYPMGSLTKIKPEKENLDKWLEKYKGPYVISDKLDGMSAQLYRKSEKQFELYSRGNGIEGTDISHLIKFVATNDMQSIPVGTSVRGEIIISKKDFEQIADRMKNPRSAAAGLVNSKTVDKYVAKVAQFITYSILHPEYKQDEQMKLLADYGFKVVNYKIVDKLSYKMLSEHLIKRRDVSEFEIDGIVVFDNSKVYNVITGNPAHGFAFKTALDDQMAETKIKNIEWNPSKDGLLKPTIEVEPIDLGGTTITHATAFNAKYVVDNKLGKGAVVKIIRSGDVIPYIQEIVKPAKQAQMPDVAYEWNESGVDIILSDTHGAQADVVAAKIITHFFQTLGVEFIGEGIVTKFVGAGYKTIPDVVDGLKNHQNDLEEIDGVGTKMLEKIWSGLKNALDTTDVATLMASSNVFGRGFGRRRLHEITDEYPNIMTVGWNKQEMIEKIKLIKGFSTITATQFSEQFDLFKKFFNKLNKIVDISHMLQQKKKSIKAGTDTNNAAMQGVTVVFTGFRDKDLEKLVAAKGGKVSSSVSGKTSFVVKADDSEEVTGKIEAANAHNIPILGKTDFIKKFNLGS